MHNMSASDVCSVVKCTFPISRRVCRAIRKSTETRRSVRSAKRKAVLGIPRSRSGNWMSKTSFDCRHWSANLALPYATCYECIHTMRSCPTEVFFCNCFYKLSENCLFECCFRRLKCCTLRVAGRHCTKT